MQCVISNEVKLVYLEAIHIANFAFSLSKTNDFKVLRFLVSSEKAFTRFLHHVFSIDFQGAKIYKELKKTFWCR